MLTITNDYRDAQILNLGSGGERGPYLVTQTGVAPPKNSSSKGVKARASSRDSDSARL
jgi:hypothetical protein